MSEDANCSPRGTVVASSVSLTSSSDNDHEEEEVRNGLNNGSGGDGSTAKTATKEHDHCFFLFGVDCVKRAERLVWSDLQDVVPFALLAIYASAEIEGAASLGADWAHYYGRIFLASRLAHTAAMLLKVFYYTCFF